MNTVKQALTSKHFVFYYSIMAIIVLPVFIELSVGFLIWAANIDLPLGVAIRGLMVVALAPFIFLIKDRILQTFFFLVFFLWTMNSVVWVLLTDEYSLTYEISRFLKFMLPYLIVAYFTYLLERFKIPIETFIKYLIMYAFVACMAIMFSYFTDIGIKTHEKEYSYGIGSFFRSKNDLSLVIVVILPFAMYFLLRRMNLLWSIICFVIIFGLFSLATRAALLGAIGIFIVYIAAFLIYRKRTIPVPGYAKVFIFVGLTVSLLIGIAVVIQNILEYPYLVQKFMAFGEGNFRGNLPELAKASIAKRDILYDIFGEGNISFFRKIELGRRGGLELVANAYGRGVEMAYWDFVGPYGFVLGQLIVFFPVLLLFKMVYHFILDRSLLNMTMCISLGLFVFHAFAAGHAMSTAQPATIICVVYFYVLRYRTFNPPLSPEANRLPGYQVS